MTAGIQKAALFAGSFTGKVGPAVEGVIGFVRDAADVVQSAFVPAISAAAGATLLYGLTALPAAIQSLPILIGLLAGGTVGFVQNAIAAAAAVGPYLLVAAAVAGVAFAYQDFNNKVETATQKLLESRQWWTDSTAAIENYGKATGEAQTQLEPYAATIQAIQDQIKGEIDSLAKRDAAGLVSDEQRAIEMAQINQHSEALKIATNAYNQQEQSILRTAAASVTGTAQLAVLEQGEVQLGEQTNLTQKEFEELEKQIKKTFEDGAKAVSDYVGTNIGFMADLEKAQAEHDTKTLEQQALAFAQQAAAQKAHLGQMLVDYTVAQVQMGNIQRDRGQAIIQQIESQFGTVQDISSKTFLAMTADIDKAAQNGGAALGRLGQDLGKTADDAITTKQRMDELAKQYTAELIQNFNEGKIDADELRHALEKIPSRVYSEVVTHHIDTYETRGDNVQSSNDNHASGYRAAGGPVIQGTAYVVGERGPELFVPDRSGTIVPNGQGMGAGSQINYNLYYTSTGGSSPEEDVRQAMRIQQLLYG